MLVGICDAFEGQAEATSRPDATNRFTPEDPDHTARRGLGPF
jgi:hypothetical protein